MRSPVVVAGAIAVVALAACSTTERAARSAALRSSIEVVSARLVDENAPVARPAAPAVAALPAPTQRGAVSGSSSDGAAAPAAKKPATSRVRLLAASPREQAVARGATPPPFVVPVAGAPAPIAAVARPAPFVVPTAASAAPASRPLVAPAQPAVVAAPKPAAVPSVVELPATPDLGGHDEEECPGGVCKLPDLPPPPSK
ncbi:MAG: hypothetical protein IT460_03225 [Planctomycetes bacterium]|nr:hypothetical protein [Planctomycetota bacterium]